MKKRCRQWVAILLLGAVCLLEGCAGRKDAGAGQDGTGAPLEMADSADREVSMGRYLEQEVALPEEITSRSTYPRACLQQLENGDLALMEQAAGLYLSSDHGATWIKKPTPWYEELDAYVGDIALAPDGAIAVIYTPYKEETSETEEEEEASADPYEAYDPQYLYADPEGNTRELKAPDPDTWLNQFWFGRDSCLYACDLNGRVYEMDAETGAAKELLQIEGVSEYVCFTDHTMLVFGSRDEAALYDTDSRMTVEDRVLEDFIKNNVGSSTSYDGENSRLVAAAGEQEDVLYLAYSGGLYRHASGGSVMEQLMDGSLNSLGDPQIQLCGFAVLPDNEFLILYDHARLYRYVYDPDIPTVPEEQIRIYSLTEDYTIRQAVSLYQKQHPEVYVHYETGLSPDGSMTAEDAVKNLNTRIMSGTGPDLLVLDGLPWRSYEEKGVLTDLSSIVHDMNETDSLFKNLVDACRLDGKLYYLPVRFRLPLLVGDRESVDQVKGLNSLAGAVEALREKYPEGSLIGLRTEEEVLNTLKLTCAGAWTDPVSGTVDREKLTEFLQNARRIYQAETAGIRAEELEDYQEDHRESWQSDVTSEGMYYAVASANAIDVAMETQRLGVGLTYRVDCEFNAVTTLAAQEEDLAYAPWQGQIQNGFIPRDLVGICSGSGEKEPVLEFFRFLYGRELQDLDLPAGYPVNEASFEMWRENPREDDLAGIVIISDENDRFALDIRWSPAADFERLLDMVRSASVICTGDASIETVVCELGVKALNGSASVEDTVEEIVKRSALYLSE